LPKLFLSHSLVALWGDDKTVRILEDPSLNERLNIDAGAAGWNGISLGNHGNTMEAVEQDSAVVNAALKSDDDLLEQLRKSSRPFCDNLRSVALSATSRSKSEISTTQGLPENPEQHGEHFGTFICANPPRRCPAISRTEAFQNINL